ncbi:flagellar assembly peptidoglycan hydrolase FlgJ [Salinisphaera sp. SPP-AMP-43]|uniref:flagellar assembly peptidoglycan hydrolase FlgJ n=1 Tax=Salinisphaera sp. SPP-AMP-43 TaxID=3121288 RepID=UPI003C6E6998
MAATNDVSSAFALDVNAVSKLKYSANKHDGQGVHKAAQQFEAMFIKQMLSSMRDAIPKSDLLGDSSANKQYQDMMDGQWSQTLAKRGMGLADMLTQQLTGQSGGASAAAASAAAPDQVATIAKADPKPLAASDSLAAIQAQREAAAASKPSAAGDAMRDGGPLVASRGAPILSLGAAGASDAPLDDAAGYVRDFVDRLGTAADGAASKTGLSSRLILAQAALETGWGRHETTTESGQPSHNVFNIKSTGWDGASTEITTHEFAQGAMQRTRAGFRVYDSYEQAFDDYARLINDSPRYAPARDADSPEAAARALQAGGYATDPNYADKLVSVMDRIPASQRGGLFADSAGAVVDLNAQSRPIA